ncbi:hypothetical protein SKAU_G00050920 [Synaphobranchus kaupii]|uniref:TIR domain-containing protein n=1 Tax=Synaphobranchus kaupii TaxID=118154 RepID=A0A9Q1G308_SYNKA|nr:hypothetical protein SKAU_G00050920 [Synaphobranchus kaupii]
MSEREREAREEKPQRMVESGAGTALEDAFKLLSLAPRDRLLSLTFKLGHTRAEELVHAMSLIGLGKRGEALGKLRALGDNGVAGCLVETVERRGSRPEASWRGGGLQPEPRVDTTIELARIFRVLADEKLCDESRRDQAYRAALRACSGKTANEEERRKLGRLVEEAREVCGSEFGAVSKWATPCRDEETLSAVTGLCSNLPLGTKEPGRGTVAMRIEGRRGSDTSRMEGASSPPSSLRTVLSSRDSYPSHLEVSMSPTVIFDERDVNQDVQDSRSMSQQTSLSEELQETTLSCRTHSSPEDHVSPGPSPAQAETQEHSTQRYPLVGKLSAGTSLPVAPPGCIPQPRPLSPGLDPAGENHWMPRADNSGSRQIVTPKSADAKTVPERGSYLDWSGETSASASSFLSKDCKSETQGKHLKQEGEEEEEFFSFVILHAPEDVDLAGRLQERLEPLVVGNGTTFSDFAIPGKHRLSCVDDAINNSAFTILLLSQNFNSRMLEFECNCALMSSIENRHKSNTVIPLLPSENRLPREHIPASLRILVSLEEGARGFDMKVKKAMGRDNIERQKYAWRQERRIQARQEQEQRTREDNERSAALLRRTEILQEQERLNRVLQEQQKMLDHYRSLLNTQPSQTPAPGLPPFPTAPGAYCYPPYAPAPPYFHNHYINPEGQLSLGAAFPQPSIHIENASCIMIGNDSQMTVGMGGEKPMEERGKEGPGS